MSLTQSSKMNPNDEEGWTVVPKKSNKKEKMSIAGEKKKPTNKNEAVNATKPFIVKEEMTIEPDLVGFIIGRKGCNLENLKKIYGVKFTLPPKGGTQMMIEGPAKMVSAAVKDIDGILSCKTRFFIEKDFIPRVIGREGERLQAIEQALNVDIKILPHDGEVVITGTRCEEARKTIEENLSVKTSFFVEKDYIVMVIGREGKSLHALENAFNVRVDIDKENGEVVVTGVRCEEAKNAIEERLSCKTSFFIEKDYTHLVSGQEGKNLLCLEEKFEVYINVNREDGKVMVSGKECKAAKKAIESLIKRLKIEYPYQEKFAVPSDLIGFVCGKNGSNRKRIESTHNVHVFISTSTKDFQTVIVKGPVARNVSDAKKDILENLPWTTRFDVDDRFVEMIIGPEGETVRRLEMEHKVAICLRDGKVYISGMEERTEAAKDAIISIMSKFKKNGGDATSP